MGRIAAIAGLAMGTVAAVALFAGCLAGTDRPAPQAPAPVVADDARPDRRPAAAPAVDDRAVAALARRWVEAAFSRRPGEGPAAWLEGVADITHGELAAELARVRPWVTDGAVSSTVTVTGVHPHAGDPATVTVTCVADIHTAAGLRREPCVATVTVAAGPDGRLLVVTFR